MLNLLYQKMLKPVLFEFEPDLVHDVFIKIGMLNASFTLLTKFISNLYGKPQGLKTITVDGPTD